MTAYNTIKVSKHERRTTVTLNRPQRKNALTGEMIAELTQAIAEFEDDTAALVLVLTGEGDTFCSGLDLSELQKMTGQSEAEQQESAERIARLMYALYSSAKPTIAVVSGAAVAGGMGLATICDFTIAAREAKFGYPEVRIGFIPAIVSAFLVRQVGDKQARDLLLTGRLINAEEAFAYGLVTRVVERTELSAAMEEVSTNLVKNSPQSLAATKSLLRAQQEEKLKRDLVGAAEANREMRRKADFQEGLNAFLEKRAPRWA